MLLAPWCILHVLRKLSRKQKINGQGFPLLHLRRLTPSWKPWQKLYVKAERRRERLLQWVGEESSAFPLLLPILLMYFIYFSQMYIFSNVPGLGTGTTRKSPPSEVNATAVRLEIFPVHTVAHIMHSCSPASAGEAKTAFLSVLSQPEGQGSSLKRILQPGDSFPVHHFFLGWCTRK